MNAAVSVKDEASSLADNDDANDDDGEKDDAANDDDEGGIPRPRPNVLADNDKTARSRPLSFFSTSNKTHNGRDGNDVLSSSASAIRILRIIRIVRRLQADTSRPWGWIMGIRRWMAGAVLYAGSDNKKGPFVGDPGRDS